MAEAAEKHFLEIAFTFFCAFEIRDRGIKRLGFEQCVLEPRAFDPCRTVVTFTFHRIEMIDEFGRVQNHQAVTSIEWLTSLDQNLIARHQERRAACDGISNLPEIRLVARCNAFWKERAQFSA